MLLRLDWEASGRLLICSVVVGVVSGLIAFVAYSGLMLAQQTVRGVYQKTGIILPEPDDYPIKETDTAKPHVVPHKDNNPERSLFGDGFRYSPRKETIFGLITVPRYWVLLLLIPALGGLLCGYVVWSFAPEAQGEGTDSWIRAYHFRSGVLRDRVALVKGLAGFFTMGSGGSAGWEGPVGLFCAGVTNSISRWFKLTVSERRSLLLAGTAGGIGAILQVPLGGALFAVEILYASAALELIAIAPCLIASFVGYLTFRLCHTWYCSEPMPSIDLPSTVGIHHPMDIVTLLLLIPILVVCGLMFVRIVLDVRNKFFRRLSIPECAKPAVGGFLLGVIILAFPWALGGGYEWLPSMIRGDLPFLLIVALIVPKMLATSFTISSGGSGGYLAPSLFIGGLIGGAYGHGCRMSFEFIGCSGWAPDLTTCVLIGMGAFYAGIGKVPLAAAVIVCELVGNYSLLVPLLAMSYLHLVIHSPSTSLYEEQVLQHVDSEAHFGNLSVDLLRAIQVQDAVSPENAADSLVTIPEHATIQEAVRVIASRPDTIFPVVDDAGLLLGLVPAEEIWSIFRNRKRWETFDICKLFLNAEMTIHFDDNLYDAMRICTQQNISELPIVDSKNPRRLRGVIRRHEMIIAYNDCLSRTLWG